MSAVEGSSKHRSKQRGQDIMSVSLGSARIELGLIWVYGNLNHGGMYSPFV